MAPTICCVVSGCRSTGFSAAPLRSTAPVPVARISSLPGLPASSSMYASRRAMSAQHHAADVPLVDEGGPAVLEEREERRWFVQVVDHAAPFRRQHVAQ